MDYKALVDRGTVLCKRFSRPSPWAVDWDEEEEDMVHVGARGTTMLNAIKILCRQDKPTHSIHNKLGYSHCHLARPRGVRTS